MNFIVAHHIRETEFLASFDRTRLVPANFVPGSACCQSATGRIRRGEPAAFGSLPNAPVDASVLTSVFAAGCRELQASGLCSPDKECRDGAIAVKI
jgi:hypothetical protein